MNLTQSLGVIAFSVVMSLLVFKGGQIAEHYRMQGEAVNFGAGHYASDTAEFKWGPADFAVSAPMPEEFKTPLRVIKK